jgi:hypothetical protein
MQEFLWRFVWDLLEDLFEDFPQSNNAPGLRPPAAVPDSAA